MKVVTRIDIRVWIGSLAYSSTVGAFFLAISSFDSERVVRDRVSEGLLAPCDEYEYTFKTRGTYEYYCIPTTDLG